MQLQQRVLGKPYIKLMSLELGQLIFSQQNKESHEEEMEIVKMTMATAVMITQNYSWVDLMVVRQMTRPGKHLVNMEKLLTSKFVKDSGLLHMPKLNLPRMLEKRCTGLISSEMEV